jgi:hypothetical protein
MQLQGKVQTAGDEHVALTAAGVTAVEAGFTSPKSGSPQVNVANIYGEVSGQVQVGGSGNVQAMPRNDLNELITFLRDLRPAIEAQEIDAETQSDIEVYVDGLEEEAARPEPSVPRLRAFGRSLASHLASIGLDVSEAWLRKKLGV